LILTPKIIDTVNSIINPVNEVFEFKSETIAVTFKKIVENIF